MVSVYSDENSFKFFMYSAHISVCRWVGGLRVIKMLGVLQYMWDIVREWEDLKSREHHDMHTVKQLQVLI